GLGAKESRNRFCHSTLEAAGESPLCDPDHVLTYIQERETPRCEWSSGPRPSSGNLPHTRRCSRPPDPAPWWCNPPTGSRWSATLPLLPEPTRGKRECLSDRW